MGISPLSVLAGLGMNQNRGLQISPSLISATTQFKTQGISGRVQYLLDYVTSDVVLVLKQLPSFMTGIPPSGFDDALGPDLMGGISNQAQSYFVHDVPGFIGIFNQVTAHVARSFSYTGTVAQAQGMKFQDLGFSFNNATDVATGGISSQFIMQHLSTIAAEFPNLGTLFDIRQPSMLDNPWVLANNLIEQGLGDKGGISTFVGQSGVDAADPMFVDTVLTLGLVDVFKKITHCDLEEIFSVTKFRQPVGSNIGSLADVFEINNLFTPSAQLALGSNKNLSDLANKLGNIGGNYTSFSELGALLASIEDPKLLYSDSGVELIPAELFSGMQDDLGSGSGPFGNPTVLDMLGSAGGVGYTDSINAMWDSQQLLLNTDPDVQALNAYLHSTTNLDPAALQNLVSAINTKPSLQDTLNYNNLVMVNIASRITTEKNNLVVADIDVTGLTGVASSVDIMNFASQVQGFGADPAKLGTGALILAMATDDQYGDAIRASITEGKNLKKMAAVGIDPKTGLDPALYSNALIKTK